MAALQQPASQAVGAGVQATVSLLAAMAFVLSLGYGVLLPLAPSYVAGLLPGALAADVARHVGWMGGTYTFALFLFASSWGRRSDAWGRARVLQAGFGLFLLGTLVGALAPTLPIAYAGRVLAGAGAAAVVPSAQAYISDVSTATQRSRRFVVVGAAVFAGVLLGPPAGTWLASTGWTGAPAQSGGTPLLAIVVLGMPLLLLAFVVLPRARPSGFGAAPLRMGRARKHFVSASLLLGAIGSFAAGTFEVGFSLFAGQKLGMGAPAMAAMFVTCGIAMLAAQGLLLLDAVRARINERWVAAAFVASAVSLGFAAYVPDAVGLGLLILSAGTGIGLIGPVLSYELLERDRTDAGAVLGRQAAAGNLGQALGSTLAGALFVLHPLAPFGAAAIVLLAGGAVALHWWGVAREGELRAAAGR